MFPASKPARFAGVLALTAGLALGADPAWKKIQLSREFFAEGGTFGDLNRDGQPDVIAGPYWYEGPDFKRRHELYAPPAAFDPLAYSDNFFAFARDFNADGWPDVLIIGFPGKDASWYENPGTSDRGWRKHAVFAPVDNESATVGELTGPGRPVLICMSGGAMGYAAPDARDPSRPWAFHPVTPPGKWRTFTHGLGYGDVNGDHRTDLLEADGWWEQPASLIGDPVWKFHRVRFGEGAQILVTDVNADGRADVIGSTVAHGYGLAWFEQLPAVAGEPQFQRHEILAAEGERKVNGVQFSQLHALALADVDGDGRTDLVTGKRWWAHGTEHDPEPNAAPVLYAFLLRRQPEGRVTFEPRLIDDASGVGTQVVATDINGDGRADVLSVNKRGAALFLSSSPASP